MKKSLFQKLLLAGLLLPAVTETARAASVAVIAGDPAAGGVNYSYSLALGEGDNSTFSAHTGGWSWRDNTGSATGWTHTSTWVALTLTADSVFTLTMSRDAVVPWPSATDASRLAGTNFMLPSFSIYRGLDNEGADSHVFTNNSNVDWADGLSYLTNLDNDTLTSVNLSLSLPAGGYSLVLGSNAPGATAADGRQGFRADFSTAPVPEPGGAVLAALSVCGFLSLRRRRSATA